MITYLQELHCNRSWEEWIKGYEPIYWIRLSTLFQILISYSICVKLVLAVNLRFNRLFLAEVKPISTERTSFKSVQTKIFVPGNSREGYEKNN